MSGHFAVDLSLSVPTECVSEPLPSGGVVSLPVVAAEFEFAVAVAEELELSVLWSVDPRRYQLVCHVGLDAGGSVAAAVCDEDAVFASVIVVAVSNRVANGGASVSCAGVELCSHWDDAMDNVAVTSDAELGTARPLRSK